MKLSSFIAYWRYRLCRRRDTAMAAALLSVHPFSGSRTRKILHLAGVAVGADGSLRPPLFLEAGVRLTLGDRVFINTGLTVVGSGRVEIGSHSLVGPNVILATATHHLDPDARRKDRNAMHGTIIVGENVWIGANVTICAGVTIGRDSTIGAGSVVNRDVPARSLAAGVPCRVIRSL